MPADVPAAVAIVLHRTPQPGGALMVLQALHDHDGGRGRASGRRVSEVNEHDTRDH